MDTHPYRCSFHSRVATMTAVLPGLLLSVLAVLLEAVGGLKLTELLGPRLADRGTSAKLSCNFDTENARLYSVKWYKDEYEFFRYMPDNHPHSQVFPRDGVTLDESMSGIDHVVLTSLSFSSTGVYRCEVSTEAPNFETLFLNHNMTVLSYPQHEPRLEGLQRFYSIHTEVAVNCTAAPSYPAPSLHWYINNLKADDYLVERSAVVRFPDDTFTMSAMLKFSAQPQHFLGGVGVLTLRCDAEAPPLDTLSAVAEVRLAGDLTNEKLAQENFRNSAGSVLSPSLPMAVAVVAMLASR
ncbi:uncharacterized protein LOC124361353 [Homalodisca vitripennis]|uniref:uncharacterized protein LOC124361353 n=1 Tax=Homalodisca vitripennis TaxID=197043 RepID=UPI001EECCF93|nr:uncharacterized protein LOC124361353 [Homalodisca vitripennis]